MRAVDMTVMNEDGNIGDCMRACVATLLELPSKSVPHFCEIDDGGWVCRTQEFLAPLGLLFMQVKDIPDWVLTRNVEPPLVMAGGKSPRGDWGHWVVGQLSRDGFEILHDPHPSRDGLEGSPEDYGILVRTNRVVAYGEGE